MRSMDLGSAIEVPKTTFIREKEEREVLLLIINISLLHSFHNYDAIEEYSLAPLGLFLNGLLRPIYKPCKSANQGNKILKLAGPWETTRSLEQFLNGFSLPA